MSKEKLSAKRITIWICVNYGIFILGFFILGSMGTDKYIVWSNFILDLCFGAFTYFAFLMPENGLPAILFYF